MIQVSEAKQYDVIIIGAGQAGLAIAFYLQRANLNFILIDAHSKVGDSWRKRWDSLVLFSPVDYNHLPGMPFPRKSNEFPTKDEMAHYLDSYVKHYRFPIRLNEKVYEVIRDQRLFTIKTTKGVYKTHQVVVATGAFQTPFVPPFAKNAVKAVFQIHSSSYTNPSQITDDPALVVGTGNSGVQIALELARTRPVLLSGPEPRSVPRQILGKDLYWWYYALGISNITKYSLLGRLMMGNEKKKGEPIIGNALNRLKSFPNVHRMPHVVGVEGMTVLFRGGLRVKVKNIIWCTGFQNNYPWIKLDVFCQDGRPIEQRGVVRKIPGLYFIGLNWLYRMNSGQVGGVGRDARFLAQVIRKHKARLGRVPKVNS